LTIPEPKSETVAADSASQDRGKALLERAAQAMGGADKLAAVKDSTETLEIALNPNAGDGLRMKQINRYLPPSTFRQEQEVGPVGKITAFTDGKTGWIVTPQGVQNMSGDVLRQARGEVFRQLETLVLSDHDASRAVSALDDHSVQISSSDGQTVKLEFDPATGLPSKETYRDAPAEVVETFSDWRDAGGVKMPYKILMEQNGRKLGDVTVSEYRLNTGLKAEDLSKRP
jgi:hypothetical protein